MNENFFAHRVATLREKRNISAREMSLSLGQSANYINKIENGKAFPSMTTFFYICEFFEITPSEFFDEGNTYPNELNGLIENLKKIDRDSLNHVSGIVEVISKQKK